MAKRMLVTGGCGFIGTNAALHFDAAGWEGDCIDDFSRSGSRINADFLREKAPKVTIDEIDIVRDAEKLRARITGGTYDAIIHAAAQVAVTSSVTDPLFDFMTNAMGTMQVLDAARQCERTPIVLFTSTNKVYGGLEHVEVREDATRYVLPGLPLGVPESMPLDFHSPYGCSKGAADQYVRDWHRIYGVPTVVFRQSCIYGPHQFGIVDQGWVAYLTMRARFGKPITIYGDGKQVRDVLHVDDLIAAMEAAITHIDTAAGRIYNIGGGAAHTLSIREFVDFIQRRLGGGLAVEDGPSRPGDQKIYVSDIRKAAQDFGWTPRIAFEEGFENMFAWIDENRTELEKLL